MDKFTLLLFNNRKALDLPISERSLETYRGFNEVIEIQTIEKCYDQFNYTWEINDGYIVGAGL